MAYFNQNSNFPKRESVATEEISAKKLRKDWIKVDHKSSEDVEEEMTDDSSISEDISSDSQTDE